MAAADGAAVAQEEVKAAAAKADRDCQYQCGAKQAGRCQVLDEDEDEAASAAGEVGTAAEAETDAEAEAGAEAEEAGEDTAVVPAPAPAPPPVVVVAVAVAACAPMDCRGLEATFALNARGDGGHRGDNRGMAD